MSRCNLSLRPSCSNVGFDCRRLKGITLGVWATEAFESKLSKNEERLLILPATVAVAFIAGSISKRYRFFGGFG
jgi:hypothetical protein